jgi:glycosyltransferase involved in cell wall biosynthesis
MNTLLLAPELFTTDSGIPRILRLYLKALCQIAGETQRVRFVTLNDVEVDSADLRPYTDPRVLTQWEACGRDKRRFVGATLRLSKGTRLIICGHVAQLPVAWLASWRRPGLRYALVAHGIEVWRPFTFLERRALRGAWRIFCVSEFTRSELIKQIDLRPERLVVLPNARDPGLDSAAPLARAEATQESESAVTERAATAPVPPMATAPEPAATRPVILTVARLTSFDRYKGIEHLIDAMPAILAHKPDVKLRIVGRGDDRPRLEQRARDLRLGDAIEFTGYIEDSQLKAEFAGCNLFALPSKNEGFGLVFAEAMACGRPCLGAREGGIPEVITPESGVLVDYGDVPALATACLHALEKNWDRDAIRARAEEFSYARFRARLKEHLSP